MFDPSRRVRSIMREIPGLGTLATAARSYRGQPGLALWLILAIMTMAPHPGGTAVGDRLELDVASAEVNFDPQLNQSIITIVIGENSRRDFADFTTRNLGQQMEMRVSGRVVSDPIIREPVLSGRAQIASSKTLEEARGIAAHLASGSGKLEVQIVFNQGHAGNGAGDHQPQPQGDALERVRTALLGVWNGTYLCIQGETYVQLTFTQLQDDGSVVGTFKFSNLPGRSNAESGEYTLNGRYDVAVHRLDLSPGTWITRPPGYDPVGFTASFPVSPAHILGDITYPGCTQINADKK
jgi:hypothetical protein